MRLAIGICMLLGAPHLVTKQKAMAKQRPAIAIKSAKSILQQTAGLGHIHPLSWPDLDWLGVRVTSATQKKGGLQGNNEGRKHLIGCHSAVDMAIYMPQLGSVFNS